MSLSRSCRKNSNSKRFIALNTLTPKNLASLDGEIVDPEITVELEMRDLLEVHDAQT